MNTFSLRRPASAAAFSACLLATLCASSQAGAQQPGTAAVVTMTLPAAAEPVQGWSMRLGLLGRPVYASPDGKQIGTVLDVIVTSAAAPYVVIIGVGGFLEIGGHAVALPRDDLVEQGGVLVLPGASRASLKAMPRFTYSIVAIERAQFIRASSLELARANAQLARLQKKATVTTGAIKAQLEQDNAAFQANITAAEDKLTDLQKAEAARWVLLRDDVEKAIARVRAGMGHPKAAPAARP